MKSSPPVAVVDIGSNSIKVLVAAAARGGGVRALFSRTIDARIGAGISRARPRLGVPGMRRGVAAVRELLAAAAPFAPRRTVLVATSAVRDARNGRAFGARVRAATGRSVRILSGDEEARLIGRGLLSDPALAARRNFYVFDLGGGSLECLAFRGRRIERRISLPLGCVRLAEKFVADPARPFPPKASAAIAAHVREVFARSGFAFTLPAGTVAIGTGGTLATVRAVRAAAAGRDVAEADPLLPVSLLRRQLARAGAQSLARRKKIPGLPPGRADVFPTALATVIAVAELGGFRSYLNSLHNLRWGLAAELLAGKPRSAR